MSFIKHYILGWGLGLASAFYGIIAALTGRAFLPGLQGETLTLGGPGATALAAAYASGGIFLFLRLVVEKGARRGNRWGVLYIAENLLLAVFIGALVYVLISVDTAQ